MTPAEAVIVLQGLPKVVGQAQRAGMSKGLGPVALEAQRAASQRGIVRALLNRELGGGQGPIGGAKWGSAGKGLYKVSVRLQNDGTTVIGKVLALGIAGLQERGGRTKPHDIRSKRGHNILGAIGRMAASTKNKPVHHPGSRVKAIPTLDGVMRRAEPRVLAELDRALQAAADRIDRAA